MSKPIARFRFLAASVAVLALAAGSAAAALAGSEDPAFRAFAARAEESITSGDGSFLNAALDFDALLDISMRGLPASPELVRKFRASTHAMGQLGSTMVDALKQGGSYRLLSVREVADRPHALLRIVHANGVNYHEFALGRDASGSVRVVDFYVFTSGEWASSIVRRNWLDALIAEDADRNLELTGFDYDYARGVTTLAATTLANEGRFDAALDSLLRLPASVQAIAPVLILRVRIAQRVDETRYAEAVDAFARRASTEPALNLLLHEMYWTRGEIDSALAALEGLRQVVGDDAYVDFLRGNLLYGRPDVAAGKRAFEQAIDREPSLPNPHWALLDISIAEKDYAGTARLLTAYEPFAPPSAIERLIVSDEYTGFVRSDEYRRWQETRRGVGPGASTLGPEEPVRVGGDIRAPERIVHAEPVYPEIAIQARVQGVVILECLVSPEGRVTDVKVLRSIPLLDQAAIDAARQWVYEPTLLDGRPVPVILTATTNFRLDTDVKNR